MTYTFNFADLAFFKQDAFGIVTDVLLFLAVVLVFGAILINFLLRPSSAVIKRSRRSIVETGTMTIFFVVFWGLCQWGIGSLAHLPDDWGRGFKIAGLLLIYFGLVINAVGRLTLRHNWGNQIVIYQGHQLIQGGVYRWIRHPLYSSTILLLYGMGVVFRNPLVLLLNSGLFIPFMIMRVHQEERVLVEQFPEYADYRRATGMLLPRFSKRGKTK